MSADRIQINTGPTTFHLERAELPNAVQRAQERGRNNVRSILEGENMHIPKATIWVPNKQDYDRAPANGRPALYAPVQDWMFLSGSITNQRDGRSKMANMIIGHELIHANTTMHDANGKATHVGFHEISEDHRSVEMPDLNGTFVCTSSEDNTARHESTKYSKQKGKPINARQARRQAARQAEKQARRREQGSTPTEAEIQSWQQEQTTEFFTDLAAFLTTDEKITLVVHPHNTPTIILHLKNDTANEALARHGFNNFPQQIIQTLQRGTMQDYETTLEKFARHKGSDLEIMSCLHPGIITNQGLTYSLHSTEALGI